MTLDALRGAERAGTLPPLQFFWGPHAEPDGRLGPGCLSQWWPAPFERKGRRFATAEHYMMWRKAVLFGDARAARDVLADPDPAVAKAVGRTVAGFDGAAWAEHRFAVVVDGNRGKFGSDPALGTYLLGTGEDVLVEASPVDAIWGIGLAADHPDAGAPSRWPGHNLLGFALMRVRAELARTAQA
ncbi:MAG: NADAR family protein [Pseudonocardia sp.]